MIAFPSLTQALAKGRCNARRTIIVATVGSGNGRGVSRVAQAYDLIKSKILNNEWAPGSQHLEQEIAAQLDMSRTPVREALIQLSQEGLLEIIPRRGMRVVPLSPSDMREIYEVLYSVEAAAAELLAESPDREEACCALSQATDAMEAALEANDRKAWAAADGRFHQALLDACGNKRLRTVAMMYADQVYRARMFTLRLREMPTRSTQEHRSLVEAIRAGNRQRAREIHRDHRYRAGRELLDILRRYEINQL